VIRALDPADVARVTAVLGLARLHQGDGSYLVAWEDGEPVGHLHLAMTEPPELQDLEVRDVARGRGIATALIAEAESRCAERGWERVRVAVSVDNPRARRLYERLGYEDVGIPPRRVTGTVQLRAGPLEVDDTLLTLEKALTGA